MATRDYRLLDYFVQIVDNGSLRAAAERLHVSPPVISKALSDLELLTGVTLLIRGPGQLKLTDQGQQVYDQAKVMEASAAAAMAAVSATARNPSGKVAITTVSELSLHWLPGVIQDFVSHYPNVTPEIHAVDHIVDLKRSDCDIAIRAKFELNHSGHDTSAIARLPVALVCAPTWAPQQQTPTIKTLANIPYVAFTFRESNNIIFCRDRKSGRKRKIKVQPKMFINNGFIGRELAINGLGMAMVIEAGVRDDIEAGRLVKLAPELDFGSVALRLIYRDKYPSEPARAFVQFLLSGDRESDRQVKAVRR